MSTPAATSPAAPATTLTPAADTAVPVAPPAAAVPTPSAEVVTPPAEVAAKPADIELKFADGVKVDDALVTQVKGLAKDLGLDSPKAQRVADAILAAQKQAGEAQASAAEKQHAEWVASLKADKEIGGAALEANAAIARRAVQKFGSPELVQLLNATGLGDHPAVVRFALSVAKSMAEDSVAGGGVTPAGNPEAQQEAHLRALYRKSPQMFSKE